jgi:octopine/nopaline transport system permease protein
MLSLLAWGPTGWLDELTFATGLTLLVALAGFAVGTVFGTLAATAKLSRSRLARVAAEIYTTVLRGVPDLLVIYLFYFGGSAAVTAIAGFFGATGFVGMPAFLTAALASSMEPTRPKCCVGPILRYPRANSKRRPPAA